MKKYILLFGLLSACAGPDPVSVPPATERLEYTAPDWSRDASIASINSKISVTNQQILLQSMRAILDRELELFTERARNLQEHISFEERRLDQIIEDYPGIEVTPSPEDEENFVSYCASVRIQLELLRLQQFHEDDLNRIRIAINRLAISLPKEP